MKRSNIRGSFAFALLLALVLPILAACGGSAATVSPTAATAPTAAAAAPTAAQAAPTAGSAEAPTAASAEAPTAAAEAPTAAAEPPAGTTANAKPGILRLNHGAENDNNDPQQASFVNEIQWIMLNWQALMTFDLKMNPIPGQAESVETSADGKLYTFHLRPNAKFSNGDPLTAKNFEFAWKRLADPTLAGQYQFIGCDVIKGFSEYAVTTCADKTGATKTITEANGLDLNALRDGVAVKAVDDNTLTIELVNPAPYFLSMAALWIGVPVREEDANSVTDLVTGVPEHFIGNGPFMLTEHEQGTKAVWAANPNYQGPLGPVKLKGIEMAMINESAVAFQAYKNGELDIGGVAAEDLSAVESDPVLSKEYSLSAGSCTFYLGFNTVKPPFDNVKVRQAFAQAFDREAWVRDVFQGLALPTQTFIPPGFPGYEKSDSWAFNADAAKKSLADAGFADVSKLPPIKLTFSASARNKVRFEWVANQLKQNLGIDAQLDPVDPTAYTALVKDTATTPQLFYLGWCADYPDPQDWLTLVFKTGGSSASRISWSNKAFDDLVTKADIEPDTAKRADLYSQAQKILIEDAPVAFTSNDVIPYLIKPYVKGITKDTITPLDYIPGFFNLKELDVAP